jgi:hypothetical protein
MKEYREALDAAIQRIATLRAARLARDAAAPIRTRHRTFGLVEVLEVGATATHRGRYSLPYWSPSRSGRA